MRYVLRVTRVQSAERSVNGLFGNERGLALASASNWV